MLQVHKKYALAIPTIAYKSLEQVLTTLTKTDVFAVPEVKRILNIATQLEVIKEVDGNYEPIQPVFGSMQRTNESPFVVIEGLDGCGKTTLTSYVRDILGMKLLATPPSILKEGNLRDVMDVQSPPVRRAYYSLGNYVAAKEVLDSQSPVIMDRFWHSTAAYAVANVMRDTTRNGEGDGEEIGGVESLDVDLNWPDDLVKPNLVIFLSVSETERLRRHQTREAFTNTSEEQALAAEGQFRANLSKCYHSISGVPFENLSVDSSFEESKSSIVSLLLKHFPSLTQS